MTFYKKFWVISLEVQWLGLQTSNAEGAVLIPGWGIKFLHVKQPKKFFFLVYEVFITLSNRKLNSVHLAQFGGLFFDPHLFYLGTESH